MNNYDDIKRFKEKLNMEAIDYKEIAESNPNKTSHNWAIINQVATADEPFHPLDQGRSTQPTPTSVSEKEFSASILGEPMAAQRSHAGENINRDINAISAQYRPQTASPTESFASPLMSAVNKALPAARPAAINTPGDDAPAGATIINAIQQEFATQPARAQEPPAATPLFKAARHAQSAPAATPLFEAARHAQSAPGATPLFEAARHAQSAPGAAPVASSGRASANAMPFNRLFNRKPQSSTTLMGRDMPLSLLLENIALCR